MPRARHLVAFAVAMALAAPAAAQPTDPAKAKAKALDLYAESRTQYEAGAFEQAAQLLRDAYALYPEPILLYNLARALEGMGDTRGAVEQYEKYLATATDIKDRGAIERRVDTLKIQIEQQDEKERIARDAATLPKRRPETERPAEQPQGRSILPWVTVGVGVAIVGAGGAMGYLATQRHDAAVDEPIHAESRRLQDQAETYATTANVLFIAGGVVVAGGVVWAVLDR